LENTADKGVIVRRLFGKLFPDSENGKWFLVSDWIGA
jgi:hypothetical protein